jgi:hypothetical protein
MEERSLWLTRGATDTVIKAFSHLDRIYNLNTIRTMIQLVQLYKDTIYGK